MYRKADHNLSRSNKKFFALSVLALGINQAVYAADDTNVTELPAIQVRDTLLNYSVNNTSAGSRTNTPIEQIPQSIVVIPKVMIEDQGITTLSGALRNVSNVNSIDERDANNVTFKIRGFNSATVVDGVAMPAYSPNQESLASAERVEVIKGPAGSLFGNAQGTGTYGTLGGTIAITTSKANSYAPVRKVGIRFGSFAEKAGNFDFNQPINSVFAARLSGEVSDKKSESNGIFFKKIALSPSLAWTPSADTEVVLRGRYLDSTTLDYSALPVNGTLSNAGYTLPRSFNVTAAGMPNTNNKSQGVNLQINQRLNDKWKLALVAAYNDIALDQRGAYTATQFNPVANPFGCFTGFGGGGPAHSICGLRMMQTTKTTTLSPSVTSNFDLGTTKHTVNLGLDYEKTKDEGNMLYSNMFGYLGDINVNNPIFPAWVEPVVPAIPDMRNTYTASVAYAQDQIDIGAVHLLGSLRHSKIDITDVFPAMGINNVTSNSKTTPRVGATYDFTHQISSFVGYSEGIKVPTIAAFAIPPKPEQSTQQEIGLRLKDFAGITATFAWFDLVRTNVAIADPNNTGFSIQSGKQRSTGIDADLRWQATPAWSWITALTSQQASIVEDTDPTLVGKRLFNVPEQTLRLATRYDIIGGAYDGLGLGLGLTDSSKLAGNSSNTFFTPAATVWDAQVAYTLRSMKFGVNINNLLNKKYYVPSAYFAGGQVTPALPRTISATANFSF